MKYMIDTNMCIYALKNHPEKARENFYKHFSDGLCISSIVLSELMYGIEKSQFRERNYQALQKWIMPIEILPFGDRAAVEYGKLCAYLRSCGTPIGNMDMLIAAHAKSEGLMLVTNNTREFAKVPELQLENWI